MKMKTPQDFRASAQAVSSQPYDRDRMLFALGAVEGGMDAARSKLPSNTYAELVEAIYEWLDGKPIVKVKADDIFSHAQANGRGSAGECPASSSAKTPAAGARCYRVAGVATAWQGGDILSLCVNLHESGGGVG